MSSKVVIKSAQKGQDAAPSKTTQVQRQVDEVVGIMQENIDKVMQRGERLDDLRGKTGKMTCNMFIYMHSYVIRGFAGNCWTF